MAGKVRHFKERNGRYSARIVVPKDLRSIIGKAELETQLGPDRRRALTLLPAAVAALQRQIGDAEKQRAEATASPIKLVRYPLTEAEIAFRDYHILLAFDQEARSHNHSYASTDPDPDEARLFRDGFAGKLSDDELDELVGHRIRRFQRAGNTDEKKGTAKWRSLAQALCVASYEALSREWERNEGDFTGKPSHPLLANATPAEEEKPPVSLKKLLDDYLKELERTGKGQEARRRWTPAFADLVAFLKHDDANRLTDDDVIRWKEHLAETLSPRTIRDVNLASLRAVLKWAKAHKRIATNPAADITVKVGKPVRTREKGFRDDEALAILKATQAYERPERENPKTAAAKKWASLLCALTGARIVEITQLRKEDFRQEGDIHVMRITPDAGSVKTDSYRDVPLHPQIVERGFLDVVKAAPAGPLFHSSKPESALKGARIVSGRVSQWLQKIEVVPEGVDPNHGWRHRFKTVARELGLDARIVDAIQGHAARTAGDNYGDVTPKAMKAAIDQIPAFDIK